MVKFSKNPVPAAKQPAVVQQGMYQKTIHLRELLGKQVRSVSDRYTARGELLVDIAGAAEGWVSETFMPFFIANHANSCVLSKTCSACRGLEQEL